MRAVMSTVMRAVMSTINKKETNTKEKNPVASATGFFDVRLRVRPLCVRS